MFVYFVYLGHNIIMHVWFSYGNVFSFSLVLLIDFYLLFFYVICNWVLWTIDFSEKNFWFSV